MATKKKGLKLVKNKPGTRSTSDAVESGEDAVQHDGEEQDTRATGPVAVVPEVILFQDEPSEYDPEAVEAESLAVQEPQDEAMPNEPVSAPKASAPFTPATRDPRLPPVGSVITRNYKSTTLTVKVLDNGFEFNGETYSSISKLAKEISGHQAVNGFAFFKLGVVSGGKGHSGVGLQAKITKLERLTVKMRAALEDGFKAMTEAEKALVEMKGEAGE